MQCQQCGQHAGQQADRLGSNLAATLMFRVRQPAIGLLVQLPLSWIGPELTGAVMNHGQSDDTHHRDEDAPDQPRGLHAQVALPW